MTTAYKAFTQDAAFTADTPRAAAQGFFNKYPTKRKCTIWAGTVDGSFFTVAIRLCGRGVSHYNDVTKKSMAYLPNQ